MGVRRANEQSVRNITQNNSGTYQVSLPIALVRELRWQQGQKVVIKKSGEKLIIQDWKK